jgi:large subunit ribosomal protein L30
MSEKVRVKLVHSPIGTNKRVRATVRGLGLRKVGSERELERTAPVEGMIKRLKHLVAVIES